MSLLEALFQLQDFLYIETASLTILVYDYLLCFGAEYQHVWRARWNTGKWLYLAIRYNATIELTITTVISLAPGARSQALYVPR
jgi:hypothetical protein